MKIVIVISDIFHIWADDRSINTPRDEFSYFSIWHFLNTETSAQSTVIAEGYQQNGMFGQGSERCKIFKVKNHESILEQSKKDVIRDSSPGAVCVNSGV